MSNRTAIPSEIEFLVDAAHRFDGITSEEHYDDIITGRAMPPSDMDELCAIYARLRDEQTIKRRDNLFYYLRKSAHPDDRALLDSIDRLLGLIDRLADARVGPFYYHRAPQGQLKILPDESDWLVLPSNLSYLQKPAEHIAKSSWPNAPTIPDSIAEELQKIAPRVNVDLDLIDEWINSGNMIHDLARATVYSMLGAMDELDLLS